MVGSGIFFDGAEAQLIGALPGETKEIEVTFPEEYPDSNLAGKTAVYKVTINSIQIDKVPELTDEFVKGISDCETVEAYQEDYTEDEIRQEVLYNRVLDFVVAAAKIM